MIIVENERILSPRSSQISVKVDKVRFLVYLYLLLSPIVDLLTGICIFWFGMPEAFIGSPSQILRFLFLVCSIIYLKGNELKNAILLFAYLLIIETLYLFYTQSISAYLSGINYSMKILYIYTLYCMIVEIHKDTNEQPRLKLIDIFLWSACLYSLGIIIPTLLGISVGSYSEGTFGQKGLYTSGNALGIYLGISFCISLIRKDKTFWNSLQSLLLLSAIILLGTKTAFIFIIAGSLIYLKTKSHNMRLLLIILAIALFTIYFKNISKLLGEVYDVVLYRFDNRNNLLTFILSGRNNYISDAFSSFFQSNIWPIKFIFGGGAFLSFRDKFSRGMHIDVLEMDLFDVFFMYGLVGLITYFYVIVYTLKSSHKKSRTLYFLFFLFFLHSVLAGHVVFDGLPIISGLMLYYMLLEYNSAKSEYTL